MKPTQHLIQPDSIVDLAFQFNKENYNLHIDTHEGLISLYKYNTIQQTNELNNETPLFIQLLK